MGWRAGSPFAFSSRSGGTDGRPAAAYSSSNHVLSGTGLVRHQDGTTPITAGDAFLFRPGQPHQLISNGAADLVVSVVADNPLGESCHYPDSGKWLVRSPERRLLRSDGLDYFDGEE